MRGTSDDLGAEILGERLLPRRNRTVGELGYSLLAGAGGESPAILPDEARCGEELGFGIAFVSERWNVK